MSTRRCSRAGCGRAAVATLTYVYADSTVVLGPLATLAEPNSYDMCDHHSAGLRVPRGWEVIRLEPAGGQQEQHDDLLALADAVREAAFNFEPHRPAAPNPPVARTKRHLRVLRSEDRPSPNG